MPPYVHARPALLQQLTSLATQHSIGVQAPMIEQDPTSRPCVFPAETGNQNFRPQAQGPEIWFSGHQHKVRSKGQGTRPNVTISLWLQHSKFQLPKVPTLFFTVSPTNTNQNSASKIQISKQCHAAWGLQHAQCTSPCDTLISQSCVSMHCTEYGFDVLMMFVESCPQTCAK
jgi:hypothetical protein